MTSRLLLIAAACLVGVSAVFTITAPFTSRALPHEFPKHVLALEFASDTSDVLAVVGPADRAAGQPTPAAASDNPDRRMMRYQVAIDSILIATYALFFVTAGAFGARRRDLGLWRHMAWLAIAAGLTAAVFDIFENRAMLAAVNAGDGVPVSDAPMLAARGKWLFFFVASAGCALASWRRGWLGNAAAILFAAAGLIGAAVTALLTYPIWLGIPVSVFGLAVVLLVVDTAKQPESTRVAEAAPEPETQQKEPGAGLDGPGSFFDVLNAEYGYIRRRRFGRDPGDRRVKDSLVGLALSGGGIRSATTNLGILQTLSRLGILPMVDYICTVSGGGYIGSCLTSLLSLDTRAQVLTPGQAPMFTTAWKQFPFSPEWEEGRQQIKHLRTHGSFLVTRRGIFKRETLRSVGQLLSGTVYHLVLALLTLTTIALVYMTVLFFGSPTVDNDLRWVTAPVPTYETAYESKVEGERLPAYQHGSAATLGTGSAAKYTVPTVYEFPGLWDRLEFKALVVWEELRRIPLDFLIRMFVGTFMFGALVSVVSFVYLRRCHERGLRVRPKPGESAEDALAVKALRWAGRLSLAAVLLWVGAMLWWSHPAPAPLWLVLPIVAIAGVRMTSWIIHVLMPRLDRSWTRNVRSLWGAYQATAFYALCASIILGAFPILVYSFREHTALVGVSGIASLILARVLTLRNGIDPKKKPIATAVLHGLLALAIGVGLIFVVVTICVAVVPEAPIATMALNTGLAAGGFGVLLLILSIVGDANRLSPHYFYRDRLAEAYLYTDRSRAGTTSLEQMRDSIELPLKDLHGEAVNEKEPAPTAPLHLISCAINLAGSRDLTRKDRKSGYFLFSKYFCGSRHTGYRRTSEYIAGDVKLARAVTISGAAAGSGIGAGTFFAQAFATVLFNLRLGYWMPNPLKRSSVSNAFSKSWLFWPKWLWREVTLGTDERHSMVNLSDGGHTGDNVGIYPLLQRRCKLIIACDAECDSSLTFGSFTEALRHAYIDLGVDVDIDLTLLRPDRETGMSRSHCAVGLIRYPPDRKDQHHVGYLIYLKNSLTGDEPEPVLNYKSNNVAFPHESTADQFFDDAQFESYRALGVHIAEHAFAQWSQTQHFLDWRAACAPVDRATV